MTDSQAAMDKMTAHLSDIAGRVADCAGDVQAIRAVIEDYSRLDASTRRVDAGTIPCKEPAGEWVIADNSDPLRRLLYLHGGSWMSGSPDGYRPLAARIARATGCAVFVPDYRLAPENPFPAGLEDAVHAYRWMRARGPGSDSSAKQIVIAGDSAGGNLALAAALKLKDEGEEPPDAVVALSPAVDLTWQSPSLETHADVDPILRPDRLPLVAQAYVQDAERMDHPYVSPVFGDFHGLTSLLVQVGDREVLLDDAKRIAGRAREHGVDTELQIYPDMPHVFQLFAPTIGAADDAVDRIGDFVRSSTG